MPPPTILFVARAGAALMRRLGATPAPALVAVRHGDAIYDGYDVEPRLAARACRVLARGRVDVHTTSPALSSAAPDAWTPFDARAVGRAAGAFLEVAATATGRATFYDTLAAQERTEDAVHDGLVALCRPLYGLLALQPGATDRTRARVVLRLLRSGLADDRERAVVARLLGDLPPPRMLRLFEALREARVNNACTRKLVLRTLLGSPKLELWAVKYRRKLRRALEHALGLRRARALVAFLATEPSARTDRERRDLRRHLLRFAADEGIAASCVRFVFGDESNPERPLLRAYTGAKRDLALGAGLPSEVLEGLRNTFHRGAAPARALVIGRKAMSPTRRMAVQRQASRRGVRVSFDPRAQDAIRLYLYALECGMTEAIAGALDSKARASAANVPATYACVGILLDGSGSMRGARTQPLRPIASMLAMRDVVAATAGRTIVRVAGGTLDGRLVRPEGDTSLAGPLLELLRAGVDALFVLTDGYENAPAGRFAEGLGRARELGCATPVYQFTPVFGAETGGVRRLAPDLVPALPVANPDGLGLALLRGQLAIDPGPAVRRLVHLAHARREVLP
jgi:hypothetical protein